MTQGSDPTGQPEQQPPGDQPPGAPSPGYPPPGSPPPPAAPPPPGAQPPGYPPLQPPQQPGGYPPPPGYPQQGAPPPGYPPQGPPGQSYGYPPAPTAPQAMPTGPGGTVLDPASGLYLPPGTQLASVGRRIGAYFLAIPLFVVTLGIGYIIWGLVLWSRGTTPALRVLGMKCWLVNEGRVPTFWRMALRDFVGRIVDGVLSLITELVSFIMFVTSGKRQSLHDVVGGTTVLHDPNKVLG